MRWRKTFIEHVNNLLAHYGVRRCPVCRTGTMVVMACPVVETLWTSGRVASGAPTDGPPAPTADPAPDAGSTSETNDTCYLVQVDCNQCGYVLLFNADLHVPDGQTPVNWAMTDADRAEWEAGWER